MTPPHEDEGLHVVRRDEPKAQPHSSVVSKTERERPDSFSLLTPGRIGVIVGVAIFIGLLFGSGNLLKHLHEEAIGVSATPAPSIMAKETARPATLITAEMFRVTSIVLGEVPLAVVNGKSMAEGDSFELKTSSGVVKLRVVKIADGVVHLDHDGQMIAARLLVRSRPENSPR
jgi:hypothetical protein